MAPAEGPTASSTTLGHGRRGALSKEKIARYAGGRTLHAPSMEERQAGEEELAPPGEGAEPARGVGTEASTAAPPSRELAESMRRDALGDCGRARGVRSGRAGAGTSEDVASRRGVTATEPAAEAAPTGSSLEVMRDSTW